MYSLTYTSAFILTAVIFYLKIYKYNAILCFFCFSLKMDCEKLAQEKTEMQRHYVMVSYSVSPECVCYTCHYGSVVEVS